MALNFFKNLFGKKSSTKDGETKSFDEIYNDLGIFEYLEDGFKVNGKDFSSKIKWTEIDQINVYKKDLIAYDLVAMEIIHGEKVLTIHEELPGWFQFVAKTKEIFSQIPKDWELKIIHPAFEPNFTTIYKAN